MPRPPYKYHPGVGHGPTRKWLNFGGDLDFFVDVFVDSASLIEMLYHWIGS